jgi:prolyl oligopeptidase
MKKESDSMCKFQKRNGKLIFDLFALLSFLSVFSHANGQPTVDDYLWLEDIQGKQATQWVDAETAKSADLIKQMPAYAERYKANLRLLTDTSINIRTPATTGDFVYNTYWATSRPAGVWRRTTIAEYRKEKSKWEVLFDLDQYNREQATNWAFSSVNVQPVAIQKTAEMRPSAPRAILRLSRGGSDAAALHEFDISNKRIIPANEGGFALPESKGWASWWSPDELLVASDFGPGTMTSSGYARQLRLWQRGTPISEAKTILVAEPTDIAVDWYADHPRHGKKRLLVARQVSFSHLVRYLWDGESDALTLLNVPQNSEMKLRQGHFFVRLKADWQRGQHTYLSGSLLVTKADDINNQEIPFRTLFLPSKGATFRDFVATADHVIVDELSDIQSRLVVHDLKPPMPEAAKDGHVIAQLSHQGIALVWLHDADSNHVWVNHQDFLRSTTLYLLDASTRTVDKVHEQGAALDASMYVVKRAWAASKDGTKIPYAILQHKDAPLDSKQPTLLHAYGGFGLSLLPEYQRFPLVNWLQYGGTYAFAYIRGGGEFGPEWTNAAKGLKRQTGFDDFIAVAQSLIDTKITQPKHLGIYGGSNGGLLVSSVSVQRPELFGAVVSRVPVTDMYRYTKLLAGSSWIEEYGDPSKADDWAVLEKYSPYQNLKNAKALDRSVAMPPTLYFTNRNDDRVHPAHGRKMAAKQQAFGHPVWLFEAKEGGHSGRATPQLYAEREALIHTFLMHHLR